MICFLFAFRFFLFFDNVHCYQYQSLALSRMDVELNIHFRPSLDSCTMDAELEQNERQRGTTGGGGTSLFWPLWLWEMLTRYQTSVMSQRRLCGTTGCIRRAVWCVCLSPGRTTTHQTHVWTYPASQPYERIMTRVRAVSGKAGVLSCFNQRWVNPHNVTVKERICCPDIELLYAPREFPYTSHHRVTSSMTPLLEYRPSILRHSLQSQGISTTSLYPPAWLALYSMWTVQHVEKRH